MIYLRRMKLRNGNTKLVHVHGLSSLRLNILASRLEEWNGKVWMPR